MHIKRSFIITILAACVLLIPTGARGAANLQITQIPPANVNPNITVAPVDNLDPQPEPPLPKLELNPSLQKPPLDALDPQPEPPLPELELNTSLQKPQLDALDPQPEPPDENNEIEKTIRIEPVNMLNPQPEPPIYAKDIKILINNIPFDSLDPQPEPPMIYQGRTLVPMRSIFEQLGAEVNWDGNTRTITIKKGSIIITMQPGSSSAVVNGQTVSLDVPPLINNDRTYVPLRFISQALGNTVEWNEQTRTVSIK